MSQPPPRRFEYTSTQMANLRAALSEDRFARYLALAKGDEAEAIKRYEVNTALSEGLYGVLQGFEIVLRNSIHETMKKATGHEDWHEHIGLEPPELQSIAKAQAKIVRKGENVTVPRVVSELTFGFWSSLTGRGYADRLWVRHLHKAFPFKRLGRKEAFSRLDAIRFLRNQVAHHECILMRDLKQDYLNIIEAAGWICPDTAIWIRETTRFETSYRLIYGTRIQVPE